ncbi:MAG: hypothetical protein IRZ16_04145 [Myxococcaceae bacterium]|nr:hypothetical protein [Myxococcaceae bacterium]
MRNLAVALVSLFALVTLLQTLRAEATPFVRVGSEALSAPVPLEACGAIAAEKKKKDDRKKKKQDDKDEEDEEDYRSYRGGIAALQLVDPAVLRQGIQARSVLELSR